MSKVMVMVPAPVGRKQHGDEVIFSPGQGVLNSNWVDWYLSISPATVILR